MTTTLVSIKNMRQSTIGTADVCLKRLEYLFDPDLPKRGSVSRGMGTAYHAGLARYYTQRMENGLFVPPRDGSITDAAVAALDADIAEVDIYDWTFTAPSYRTPHVLVDRDEAITYVTDALTTYFSQGLMWAEEFEVAAVEIGFDYPFDGLEGWRQTGTIDLALKTPEGKYRLVDHKTSKRKWGKDKTSATNAQAAYYLDAWRKIGWGPADDFFYDVMNIRDNTFQRLPAPRTEAQIQATLERGRDLGRLLDQGGPFPPSPDHFLCSPYWCDFWSVCPYGQTLNIG